MNTLIEVVENLFIQTQRFKSFIMELTKSVKSARKDGGLVGSKHVKLSNEVNDVRKRLNQVGQKK